MFTPAFGGHSADAWIFREGSFFSYRCAIMHSMNWDDLRYVLAVSRDRTLSRAAVGLGVTHTTVGRRLRAIEQTLGVRLFDRMPDGLWPTPAGLDVVEVAERAEDEILALEGRILGRDAELRGSVRVATMDLLFRRYRSAFLSFSTRYPSVELTVVTSDEDVLLNRREADVALRITNTPPESLIGRKIGQLNFAVYAAVALAEQVGLGASYAEYPWLHWDERMNITWLDTWLAKNAPGARIAMRVGPNSTVLRDAVLAGIGVHFLACQEGDGDPLLVRIGPIQHEFARDIWLLTMADLRNTQRIRAFLDHMHRTAI